MSDETPFTEFKPEDPPAKSAKNKPAKNKPAKNKPAKTTRAKPTEAPRGKRRKKRKAKQSQKTAVPFYKSELEKTFALISEIVEDALADADKRAAEKILAKLAK